MNTPPKAAAQNPSRIAARIYRGACMFTLLFAFAHVVSLPVEITYDGLGYIDMAGVLGSSRFPQDWNSTRTPLYPLALKIGFWFLGRQPLAPIVVSSGLAALGILALGSAIRKIAGSGIAAAAMVVASLFPFLITYEHAVLTEAGSFFFLAMIFRLALISPATAGDAWRRAAFLCLAFTAGYYWRQNILSIAPAVALLLGFEEWTRLKQGANWQILGRMAVIALLPYALTWPWARYIDAAGLRDVTLHQGMIRQALLPPEDPYVGENAAMYEKAITDSMRNGNFYSGVTWDRLSAVMGPIFAKPVPQGTPRFFLDLIRRYPARYARGFGRTVLLFAGVKGVESDNRAYRGEVLSLTLNGSKIGDGPQPLQSRIKSEFEQRTTPSVIMRLLRDLSPLYDAALPLASVMTALGLLAAVWFRDRGLLVFCGLPVVYMLGYAVLLVAIDRFMIPIYPMTLSNLFLVPASVWKRVR